MKNFLFTLSLLFTLTLCAQGQLKQADLYAVDYLTTDGETQDINEITKYLTLELIEESVFHSKQATAVNQLKRDYSVTKIKGTLTLPCKNKKVQFTDNVTEDETNKQYSYEGQLTALNQYVIGALYWEDSEYKLIDKTTGTETASFMDMPYVSADKKYVIAIHDDIYENVGYLSLSAVTGGGIQPLLLCGFTNWIPVEDQNETPFWGKDGYFYLPVTASDSYLSDNNYSKKEKQYIRIQLLGPAGKLKPIDSISKG
jgi:hypothetical protein